MPEALLVAHESRRPPTCSSCSARRENGGAVERVASCADPRRAVEWRPARVTDACAGSRGRGPRAGCRVRGDRVAGARAEHGALEQRVRREPVRAVHAGAGDLADGVEARERRAAEQVGGRRRPSGSARPASPGSGSRAQSRPRSRTARSIVGKRRARNAARSSVRRSAACVASRNTGRPSCSLHLLRDRARDDVARARARRRGARRRRTGGRARRSASRPRRARPPTRGTTRRRPASGVSLPSSTVGWNWKNSRSRDVGARRGSRRRCRRRSRPRGWSSARTARRRRRSRARRRRPRATSRRPRAASVSPTSSSTPATRRRRGAATSSSTRSTRNACSITRDVARAQPRDERLLDRGAGGVAARVQDPRIRVRGLEALHERRRRRRDRTRRRGR